MLRATCHCGAVAVEIPRAPERVTNCNCSICRRYGTLWAYFDDAEVRVEAAPGALDEYAWGHKALAFVRCATCGCVVRWRALQPGIAHTGVNARLFEPQVLGPVRIRLLDGADTEEYVGEHGPL
jgi:hypothetical protein